jgi:hypothetical protein
MKVAFVQTQKLSLSSQLELVLSGTKQLLTAHDGYADQNEAGSVATLWWKKATKAMMFSISGLRILER